MFFARGVCALISRESISINNDRVQRAGQMEASRFPNIKPIAYINFNVSCSC